MTDDRVQRLTPISRRGFPPRRGGLALTLPWLESLPVRADDTGKRRRSRDGRDRQAAGSVRLHLLLQRRRAGALVGARAAARRWRSAPAWRRCSRFAKTWSSSAGLFNEQAVRHKSAHLGRSPEPALRRLGQHRPGRDPRRPDDGPGPRPADRQSHGHSQPGAGHRADRAAAGRRPVDDLRLVHLVGVGHQAGDQGDLSRRASSTCSSATADGRQLDRSILDQVLADARDLRRQIEPDDRRKLDEYLESIRDIERRIDRAAAGRPARRPAADARQARPCRVPASICRRTFPSTCG